MYTLEELQTKTFKELKKIGWQLNLLPAGDRRCRQNWIDAIAGVNPPLLQLLEVSPAAEVESVAEAIDSTSKFGRIVYPKLATEPIALAAEISPSVSFDVDEFQQTHAVEIENYFGSFTEADLPPNRGDNGRDRLESEPKLSQSAIGLTGKTSIAHQLLELFKSSAHIIEDSPAAEIEAEMLKSAIELSSKNLLDAEADRNPTGVTFSDSFLARYSPPRSENIRFQPDADGQLSLLDFEIESADEPPDPDDFDSMLAFRTAYDDWCDRDDESEIEQFEPIEPLYISLASMSEWAPCPDDWYEPETNEIIETVSCTLETVSMPIKSSSTCNFSIPTFDAWCDRPNGKDEPPTAGVGARLPKPKPPSFSPAVVGKGDGVVPARCALLLSGRAPPGGDAMQK